MDHLKKVGDGNLREDKFTAETTSLSSLNDGIPASAPFLPRETIETPLRKTQLSPHEVGHLGNHSSSMDIPAEYRDFSNLDDELQSLTDGMDQFIRCRTNVLPKEQKLYPEVNDHTNVSNRGTDAVPVDVAKEATEIKLGRRYPDEPEGPPPGGMGPAPGLTMKSTLYSEDKVKKALGAKLNESTDLLEFLTSNRFRITVFVLISMIALFAPIPLFLRGIVVGVYFSVVITRFVHYMLNPSNEPVTHHWPEYTAPVEQVSKKELLKTDKVLYTGWMNLLTGNYEMSKYHTKLTQSILIHLDRDIIRFYFPKKGIKARTIWNEKKIEPKFISQEMYNITGASVCLQPTDLAPRRWWSRKYPIQITFASGPVVGLPDETQSDTGIVISQHEVRDPSDYSDDNSDGEDSETHSLDHNLTRTSNSLSDLPKTQINPVIDPKRKTIYLFARSTREKEQWFHQLRKAADQYYYKATCDQPRMAVADGTNPGRMVDVDQKSLDWIQYSSLQGLFEKTMETLIKQKIEPKSVVSMDLGVQMWKPIDRVTADVAVNQTNMAWMNALVGRIFMDFSKDPFWHKAIKERVERKMASVHLPHFIESLKLVSLEMGENVPHITSVYEPTINEWGLWVDMNIEYTGGIHCLIETKVNLMKLKTDAATAVKPRGDNITTFDDEAIPESPESLSDSDEEEQPNVPEKPKKSKGKKILNMLDKVAQSKVFQSLTDSKLVKKAMQNISDTPINLIVDVVYLEGTFVINIPTPPSERLWYGFRCPPKVTLKCTPKVGDTSVNLTHVMDWIENKVCFLLEKFLVVPNLDDFIIPLLSGGSPLLKNIYE